MVSPFARTEVVDIDDDEEVAKYTAGGADQPLKSDEGSKLETREYIIVCVWVKSIQH